MLFAVDGSAPSQHALQYGLKLATKQTSLRIVNILDQAVSMSDFVPLPLFQDALVKESNAALAAAAELLAGLRIEVESAMINTERTGDDVPHAIVREADHWNADLVVVGTHGRRGLSRCCWVAWRAAYCVSPLYRCCSSAQSKHEAGFGRGATLGEMIVRMFRFDKLVPDHRQSITWGCHCVEPVAAAVAVPPLSAIRATAPSEQPVSRAQGTTRSDRMRRVPQAPQT